MNGQRQATSGGVGLGGVLFVVFLTLKLTHLINWSWWWVTAPLWGPWLAFTAFVAGLLLGAWIVAVVTR